MAIDNRLQVFNEEGQSVDYDILASDVKFLPDGKDLPTKLAEMEAHQGDGTVKGVKMNNGSPIEPDGDGVVDLGTVITQHQDITGKVDKETGKSLMSAEEHTKLEGIETGAEKNIIKGIKANGASTNLPVDQNGVVELPPAGSTISPATASPSMDGTASVGSSDKYAREDHVHPHDSSKQNTLTFDDAPGNTDNPVKSRGIKQAIEFVTPTISPDGKWIIGGELTQHVAQGPAGNTQILDPTTFDPATQIINNVADGGDTDMLSAEMGKVIVQNLLAIYNALSPYCFAGEKPILSWGSTIFRYRIDTYGVTGGIDITDIEVDGVPAQAMPNAVLRGASLSFKLELPDDLYIFDDGLSIMMGGIEHANNANVFNKATGEVTLTVVGDVTIVANALTYIGYNDPNDDNLQLFLDGKNRGNVAGHWTSLVNYNGTPIDFTLTGCDETNDDHVYFDGNAGTEGVANVALLDIPAANATIETLLADLLNDNTKPSYILHNSLGSNNRVVLGSDPISTGNDYRPLLISNSPYTSAPKIIKMPPAIWGTAFHMSVMAGSCKINDTTNLNISTSSGSIASNANSYLALFSRYMDTAQIPKNYYKGSMYFLRVYKRQLTDQERAHNYKIDKKRFNL